MTEFIRLDYESRSKISLPGDGVDIYTRHPSTAVMMAAWDCNDENDIQFWDETMSVRPPKDFIDRLRDPQVLKWAFNAQFERLMTERVLGIKTPRSSWRCTMALSYMMGFSGTLAKVGAAMGFDATKLKDPIGEKLIKMFCKPRTPTKADKRIWFNAKTHPEEFQQLGGYNRQDVRAESAIARRLNKFPLMPGEWELYGIDQYINDTGITIDLDFARNALALADERKPIIMEEMRDLTGLENPNSPAQLKPWLRERGYPFDDLRADTVTKVITEAKKLGLDDDVVQTLRLRQNSSKSSLAKYNMMLRTEQVDGKFRYAIQFRGAARTGRYGGRDIQPQNFMRTPKWLEDEVMQKIARRMIKKKDMEGLHLLWKEPMDALAGMMRGAIIPAQGMEFCVADLASIESVVIGWLTDCRWIKETLDAGRDLYVSFASFWLKLSYEQAWPHRSKAKPATLGAGFRLGGGSMLPNGKKGGLWGYAENMGVIMTQKEAAASVKAFRELCPEIVEYWYALEKAISRCLTIKADVKCGKVTFEYRKPFLAIKLPSGRRLYYFKPRIVPVEKRYVDPQTGEERNYTQREFHYEGMSSQTKKWGDQSSHGGKVVENIVQAIANDILNVGIVKAFNEGFRIPFHVHDEIVTEVPIGTGKTKLARLIALMTERIGWAPGLQLKAAGWVGMFYRKD